MANLLINSPSGEQILVEVDATGSYYDQSRVIWDERTDGPMPEITLGKMQRVGNELVTLPDFLPEHAAAVYQKNFPVEVPMAAAREALINAGLFEAVNNHIATLDLKWCEWWNHADKIHRQFELVETVRIALGWTPQQVDNLFISAEQIRKQRAGELSN